MDIIADLSTSSIDSQKNAIGIVYIKEGEIMFPEKDWTDYVVIILGWWIEEFLKQVNGQT